MVRTPQIPENGSAKKPSRRVYFHYSELEETHSVMWKPHSGEEGVKYSELAADLMRKPSEFKAAMLRAVNEWPKSCEFNFTGQSVNRQAWIGHAGCCLAVGSPEANTRQAWHMLNQSEQDVANQMADEAIEVWEKNYKARGKKCQRDQLELMF